MKTLLMLLLTNDNHLENLVADALLQTGGVSHLAHDQGEALETVCGIRDLDLIIIDFDQSHRGLSERFDVVVVIAGNHNYRKFLAAGVDSA